MAIDSYTKEMFYYAVCEINGPQPAYDDYT